MLNGCTGKCVRLSRPLVGVWTHFKSPHFHFISFHLRHWCSAPAIFDNRVTCRPFGSHVRHHNALMGQMMKWLSTQSLLQSLWFIEHTSPDCRVWQRQHQEVLVGPSFSFSLGGRPCLLPSLSLPPLFVPSPFLLSFPPFPSPPSPSLPFPSLHLSSLPFPLEVGPLKFSYGVWGSAVSSPSGVWGGAPADKRFGAFFPWNLTSGGNNFNNFFYCKTFIMTGQPSGWRSQILFREVRTPHWRRRWHIWHQRIKCSVQFMCLYTALRMSCTPLLQCLDICVARIFSKGALFSSKSWTPFCFLLFYFLVVVLNTEATTATVTTSNLQLSPVQQKFLKNWLLTLPVPGMRLQLNPIKYAQHFFSALGVHMHRLATPMCLEPDFPKILGQTYEELRIRSDLGKS